MAMKKKNCSGPNSLGVCEKILNVIGVGPAIQKIRRISSNNRRESSAPHAGGNKTIEIHGEDADPHPHHQQQPPPKTKIEAPPPPPPPSHPVIDHHREKSPTTTVGPEVVDGGPAMSVWKPKAPQGMVGQSHGQSAAKVSSTSAKVDQPHTAQRKGVGFSREQRQSSRGGREVRLDWTAKPKGTTTGQERLRVDPLEDAFSEYITRKKNQMSDAAKTNTSLDLLDGRVHHHHHHHHDSSGKESLKDHFSDYIYRAKAKMVRSSSSFGTGKINFSFKKH